MRGSPPPRAPRRCACNGRSQQVGAELRDELVLRDADARRAGDDGRDTFGAHGELRAERRPIELRSHSGDPVRQAVLFEGHDIPIAHGRSDRVDRQRGSSSARGATRSIVSSVMRAAGSSAMRRSSTVTSSGVTPRSRAQQRPIAGLVDRRMIARRAGRSGGHRTSAPEDRGDGRDPVEVTARTGSVSVRPFAERAISPETARRSIASQGSRPSGPARRPGVKGERDLAWPRRASSQALARSTGYRFCRMRARRDGGVDVGGNCQLSVRCAPALAVICRDNGTFGHGCESSLSRRSLIAALSREPTCTPATVTPGSARRRRPTVQQTRSRRRCDDREWEDNELQRETAAASCAALASLVLLPCRTASPSVPTSTARFILSTASETNESCHRSIQSASDL